MKLYDYQLAPNPRRVRIFLAEKGITVPTVQVDLRGGMPATALQPPRFRAGRLARTIAACRAGRAGWQGYRQGRFRDKTAQSELNNDLVPPERLLSDQRSLIGSRGCIIQMLARPARRMKRGSEPVASFDGRNEPLLIGEDGRQP